MTSRRLVPTSHSLADLDTVSAPTMFGKLDCLLTCGRQNGGEPPAERRAIHDCRCGLQYVTCLEEGHGALPPESSLRWVRRGSFVDYYFAPLFEWVQGADTPDTLTSRNSIAMRNLAAGRTAEAIPLCERTLADSKRVLGADHPNTLRSRNNLAMGYRAAGRTARAIPLYERTLADCERVLGADHPDTKAAREGLAALTGEPKRHRHI